MHYSHCGTNLQEEKNKKFFFVKNLQKSVKSNSIKCQEPRKSKDSGCQNGCRIDTHTDGNPHFFQRCVNKIDCYRPQNPSHYHIQNFLHPYLLVSVFPVPPVELPRLLPGHPAPVPAFHFFLYNFMLHRMKYEYYLFFPEMEYFSF